MAVTALIAGKAPETPRLTGACYNTVAPGYAFSLSGTYQPRDGQFAEADYLRALAGTQVTEWAGR